MHAFDPTEDAPSSLDAVQVFQTAITVTGELNTQEADAASTVAERQGNLGALEEGARDGGTVTATHAEPRGHVVAVRKRGRVRSEELRENLEETPFELELVNSPTLILPDELMTEIFDCHMLMGGRLATMLLVCKRWSMVACCSPRLWARISVTNHAVRPPRRLRGSILCADLDYLRLVLSRSRSYPLQLELSFSSNPSRHHLEYSSRVLLMAEPQITANRVEVVKLILGDQVLRRCTCLVLAGRFLPFDYQNATVLPLLSSIRVYPTPRSDREIPFVQSLVDLSPALRRIHCSSGLSAENKGVGLWTKRIESYSWISTSSCSLLHQSPSLRTLGMNQDPIEPLTLPALQVLRWSIDNYSALHRVTAPHLHTLILHHGPHSWRCGPQPAGSISFPNLRVAIHEWVSPPKAVHMFHTPALEHLSIMYRSSFESIMYQSSLSPSTELLDLFDGSTHMPTPKSIHLDCAISSGVLIAMLDRLPWLEELQVAGTTVNDTFWERLVPSSSPSQQVAPATLLTDERTTPILVPNLKVLLVHYPAGTQRTSPTLHQQEMARVSKHPDEVSSGVDWRLVQASGVAVTRERAGCPLRTLACWSSEQKVDVLIGSLDSLPYRPRFVSSTALLCY